MTLLGSVSKLCKDSDSEMRGSFTDRFFEDSLLKLLMNKQNGLIIN